MARCAAQLSSHVSAGLTASHFLKHGVNSQTLDNGVPSCYKPSYRAVLKFLNPALKLRSPQPSSLSVKRGKRYRGAVRCSAQEEGGEISSEPPPLEGWERDAAAARVAELAEKAGAAGGGRRKLSFKAITAAAEGVNKGGAYGPANEAKVNRPVESLRRGVSKVNVNPVESNDNPAVERRSSNGVSGGFRSSGGLENSGASGRSDEGVTRERGSFGPPDADVSEGAVRKPWLDNQGLRSGGLKKRPERSPGGGDGLDGRKGPWLRQGFAPKESFEGGATEDSGFGLDDNRDVDQKGFRGHVEREQRDERRSSRGFVEKDFGFEDNRNSDRGFVEKDFGFEDNRNSDRGWFRGGEDRGRRNEGRPSRGFAKNDFGFEDYQDIDQGEFRGREGRYEKPSSRGSARGAPGGGWKESESSWGDESMEDRISYESPVAKDVWQRNAAVGGTVSDSGGIGEVGFRPPAPKPVWRNRQGGEELLGTSAWAARERAETTGGGRSAPEDWAERPPQGRKGDPRGPSFRKERMGVKAWDGSDDSKWGGGNARRTGGRNGLREQGSWGDIGGKSDDGEAGFDDEGEGEITSWGPRGTAKRSGARGRASTGRGSSRRDDAAARTYNPRARDSAGSRSFDPRDSARSDGLMRDRSNGWGAESDTIQRPSELRSNHSSGLVGADPFDVGAQVRNGNGFGNGLEAKAPLSGEEQRERRKMKRVKLPGPGCYGCGARLQVSDPGGPGYLRPDVYELKRNHRQLEETLCGRCNELVQGKMVPAVGGNGGHGSGGQGEGYVMAEELRDQLKPLKLNKVLVVKLVDIADFNGSFLSRVRDLVGSNPIILVCTKVDLLPADTDLEAVADWVWDATVRKKLRPIAVHLISSMKGAGLPMLAANILRERQGRDVYVLGAANVGKSAFINALLAEMSTRDPAAAAARRKRPTESAMPGTTLGPIPINAFSGGGELFDTPGIHLHHRLASLLTPEELVMITPRRRFRPVAPALVAADQANSSADPPSKSATNNLPSFPPGAFVVLRPHPDAPPEAIFIAQISAQGGAFTRVSEAVESRRLPARPWVPKLASMGANSDPWNDPLLRRWVPHVGGEFPLDPDDVIASWTTRVKAPEEDGVPIPPMTAARAKEQLGGYDMPGGSYPTWVGIHGEILNAQEWGGKVAAVTGGGWERKNEVVGEVNSSPPLVSGSEEGGEAEQEAAEGTTYFWGGVARVDVLKAPPGLRLSFYGPHTVALHAVATSQADDFYQANLFDTLTPPLANRGADWDGLPYKKECNLFSEDDVRPAGDVVVSGLGWFAVGGAPGKRGRRKAAAISTGEVRLVVHTPRGVEVYLRPPMPVTETGADWFERPALDVELDRPPIYFPRIGTTAKPSVAAR